LLEYLSKNLNPGKEIGELKLKVDSLLKLNKVNKKDSIRLLKLGEKYA